MRKSSSGMLLLVGLGLLALSKSSSPPARIGTLNQARQDPLSSSNYLNEDEIYNAIAGAGSARDALAAAQAASQVEVRYFDGAAFAVNRDTTPVPEKDISGALAVSSQTGLNYGDARTVERARQYIASQGLSSVQSSPFWRSNKNLLDRALAMGWL